MYYYSLSMFNTSNSQVDCPSEVSTDLEPELAFKAGNIRVSVVHRHLLLYCLLRKIETGEPSNLA